MAIMQTAFTMKRTLLLAVGVLLGSVSLTFGQGMEAEPNDTCLTAQDFGAVSLSFTVDGSLDTPPGTPDVDFFKFTGTPGAQVLADLEGTATGKGTLFDPLLGLFDSTCTNIKTDDDGGIGFNSSVGLTVPADGIFILAVTSFADFDFTGGGGSSGSYRLTMEPVTCQATSLPPTTGCLVNGVVGDCIGTLVDDVIVGTPGNDVIYGLDGNDTIDGLGGDDKICGGNSHDNIIGGDGDDRIDGGPGDDFISGDAGNDQLIGSAGSDDLEGGAGNDTLKGQAGDDFLDGGDDTDLLEGGPGFDWLEGGAGNDTLKGQAENDFLDGGDDTDLLEGGPGFDTLLGGAGNDTLKGQAGDDFLDGGDSDDLLDGGPGIDGCFNGEKLKSCP